MVVPLDSQVPARSGEGSLNSGPMANHSAYAKPQFGRILGFGRMFFNVDSELFCIFGLVYQSKYNCEPKWSEDDREHSRS